MGATYTRQSSSGIVDGGVIEASDLNNEFDQLLAAFVASTGHTHDGTTAEGGPITKLLGTSITIGDGTSGTDIAVTFDGESADGVLTWMEDEDYFKFSDEVLMNSTEKLLFGDTGTYIHQSADGVLDLVSDSEIEINATTIDINGAVDISGNTTVGGDLTVTGDDITMGTNTSGMLLVADGTNFNPVAVSGDVTMASTGAITIASTAVENSMLAGSIADSKLSTISTADKVAGGAIQIDSGTDGTSITLADTDKFLVDDGGTTKYINASQLNSYTSASVAADDLGTGDAAVTIATSTGDITIDAQGSDTDIIFKGTDGGADTTFLTIDGSAAGAATFNDKIIATELDISGDVDVDGTLEADAITVDGTALATYIRDTVGTNMLSSNTETGIAVTYDTSNDNIDFALEASQTVFTSITNTSLVVGRDADNDIDFATDNNIIFRAAGADQIVLKDGVLEPVTDDDVALGTTGSKRFTNLFLSGSITAGSNANITGNINTNGIIEIDVASGDPTIIFDTQGADKFHIAVDDSDSDNLVIKSGSTVGSGNGLKLDSSGNLTVTGEVSMTTLDIGGTNVTSTAAELNYCDGVTSNIQTQLNALDPTPLAIALG
jgi:hypothetical protein